MALDIPAIAVMAIAAIGSGSSNPQMVSAVERGGIAGARLGEFFLLPLIGGAAQVAKAAVRVTEITVVDHDFFAETDDQLSRQDLRQRNPVLLMGRGFLETVVAIVLDGIAAARIAHAESSEVAEKILADIEVEGLRAVIALAAVDKACRDQRAVEQIVECHALLGAF